jgi:DNA-binding MarR family transcriptional regulator
MEQRFETFTVLITKINRNIRKIKNREMAEYNLKGPHISCLYFIYLSGGLTATELCERCEEDKATVSRSLDFLEKNGFVFCRDQTKKRYKSPIELTSKGLEAAGKIASKIDSILETVSGQMSEGDRVIFYRFLTAVSDNIEKIAKEN